MDKLNQPNGYAPPLEFPMETISGNFEKDVLKQVIGRDGCYFKQITENSGVKYIWHRRETNQIEASNGRTRNGMAGRPGSNGTSEDRI